MVHDREFLEFLAWQLPEQSKEYSDRQIAEDLQVVSESVEVEGVEATVERFTPEEAR